MSESRQQTTFSAYSGASEVPADFAPVRAEARRPHPQSADAERAPGGKVRFWLLMLILVGVSGIAANQYRGVVVDHLAAAMTNVPSLNLPEIDRPVINRVINTVRLDTPLQRVTEDEVRTLLARYTESGFLGVDVQDLRDELEQNPWVAQATVRRVWPDVLAVSIREEQPIARWGAHGFINEYGEVFTPSAQELELALPLLSGPEGSEKMVLEQYDLFSQALAQADMKVSSVTVTARGSWTLQVADGPLLHLGRDQLDGRVQRFLSVYGNGLKDHLADARTIDLRYGNGFSVSNSTTATDAVARR